MPHLETLKLAECDLQELPDAIGNLAGLRDLYLYKNRLTSLPASIGRLTSLVVLHVSRNALESFPTSIGNLTALDYLEADWNALSELPSSIGDLAKLRHLNLAANRLRELPRSFTNLAALEYLNLTHNHLEALPENLGELANLQHLNVDTNRLRRLPDSLGKLHRLETLEASNNQLDLLPEDFADLRPHRISLSNNRLRVLPAAMGQNTNLSILNVANNPLRALPAGLSLNVLDISGCTSLRALPDDLVVGETLELGGTAIQGPVKAKIVNLTWHGVRINAQIAFHPETLTYRNVIREENTERRRVMIERMGYERFVEQANARVIDKDIDPGGQRRLLSIAIPEDEDLMCLSVKCPSTGHGYLLRVPPWIGTCRQAAAWIAGFDNPDDYRPLKET
jgi:hypothetical protein